MGSIEGEPVGSSDAAMIGCVEGLREGGMLSDGY